MVTVYGIKSLFCRAVLLNFSLTFCYKEYRKIYYCTKFTRHNNMISFAKAFVDLQFISVILVNRLSLLRLRTFYNQINKMYISTL